MGQGNGAIRTTMRRAGKGLERWAQRHSRILTRIGLWAAAIVIVPLVLLFTAPTLLSMVLPPMHLTEDLYAANRPTAVTFLDAKGKVVGRRGAIVGERLTLDQMPPYLPAAFIAMEDRRFWTHHGIDPIGMLRALYLDLRAGHVVAGGSTITQQVAKIVFTDSGRTFARKFTDITDAIRLEKTLTKAQILELYLNRIYLGSGAYGVDGAAHVYFGKSARDLTLPEAAMLATLTRAPSVFSPRRDLASAQERANTVLDAMVDTGAITQRQAQQAEDHPAAVIDRTTVDARNYFLDAARDEALRDIGNRKVTGDLVVHTTMEPKIQDAARLAASKVIEGREGRRDRAHEAAVVVMKTDGAIAAMIGGVDYDESTFNRAIMADRQPGSAFKPFVYLAALEAGMSPWDERTDGPVDINGWSPTNFDNESYGTVTLADAMAHSINTITAMVGQEVGIGSVIEAARRCGITSKLDNTPSLALGTSVVTPLELTGAYTTFASGGYRVAPYMVTEVDGADGSVLYKRQPVEPKRVIAAHVDRDLLAMMYQVVTEGTGRAAALWDHEVAGKTGTTQDYHDAWFVGFTTDYVAGVWVGNDDMKPMRGVVGGSLPAQIWHQVMTVAEKGLPSRPLDRSPPQLPIEADGTIDASSGPPTIADDQAPQAEQQQQQQRHDNPVGRFFDWLFGSGNSDRNTAPPPNGN